MKKFIVLSSVAVLVAAVSYAQARDGSGTAGTAGNSGNTGSGAQPAFGNFFNNRSSQATVNANNNRNNNNRDRNNTGTAGAARAQGDNNNSNNNNNGDNNGSFDRAFLRRAALDSLLEIQLGELAQTNSENSAVRELGAKLVADHTASLEQARQLAESLGFSLPDSLNGESQRAFNRLANLTGDAFDRAFVRLNLATHTRDLRLFQTAAAQARAEEVRDFARAQLPVLTEHYVMTLDLRDEMGIPAANASRRGGR